MSFRVYGFRLVISLFSLQLVAGFLSAFYSPLITPLARSVGMHDSDWNWIESATTIVGAIAIPLLTRLGDIVGYKKILLFSVVMNAASCWWTAFAGDFWSLLASYAIAAFSAVWFPFTLAIIRLKASEGDSEALVVRASSALTVVSMVGAAIATLIGGTLFTAAGGSAALEAAELAGVEPASVEAFTSVLRLTLIVPALFSTVLIFLIAFMLPSTGGGTRERFDVKGLAFLGGILMMLIIGLGILKLLGPGALPGWLVIAIALVLIYPFVKLMLRTEEPAFDVRIFARGETGAPQIAQFFISISYSTTLIPLVTYAGTNPDVYGYGMGLDSAGVSIVAGMAIVTITATAAVVAGLGTRVNRAVLLRVSPFVHACEFVFLIFFHDTLLHGIIAVVIGGIGAGIFLPGIPAAIVNSAPFGKTATYLGVTNSVGIIGISVGSAVFAIMLSQTADSEGTAAPFAGYVAVWITSMLCSIGAGIVLSTFTRQPASTGDTIEKEYAVDA